ncbi:MAG: ABC transporter permease [Treponemataceae bacterium]
MIIRQFVAMFKARTMEFVRDRGTFFWNLLFPFFLVFGLAFAFSGGEDKIFKVGVIGTPREEMPFMKLEQASFIPYSGGSDTALRKLERHQIDMVIDFDTKEFAVNKESSKGRLVRTLFVAQQSAAGSAASVVPAFSERTVVGRATRYVDWLVPGVIGMNMMFSSLFGVGYVIVRYRKNGVLKRFKATPVSALNFVSAQAVSRLSIVLLTSIFVYAGTNLFLGFVMRGSYLNLLLLTTLGILCMISLGLVFASRMRSEEMAGGVLNLITFPMLALSGVFFSLEGSPPILKTISWAFPLTHFTEASRKIMIDGAGILEIAPHLAVLAGLTVIFLSLSAFLFKWE